MILIPQGVDAIIDCRQNDAAGFSPDNKAVKFEIADNVSPDTTSGFSGMGKSDKIENEEVG